MGQNKLTFKEHYELIQKHGPTRMYYTGKDAQGNPVSEVVDVNCPGRDYNTAQKVVAKYAKSKGHTHLRLHDFRHAMDLKDLTFLEPKDWL